MFLCVAITTVIGNSVAIVVTAKLCGEFDPQQNRQVMALHDAGKSPVPTL